MQHRIAPVDTTYLIRLMRGEKVMESLVQFCEERGIKNGRLSAIGAVENAEIGYYSLETREYFFKTYPKAHEVVSMTGNIAILEEKPFLHVHTVLSDAENRTHGGHLKEAEVAVTLEVELTTFESEVERAYDDEIGLNLLQME